MTKEAVKSHSGSKRLSKKRVGRQRPARLGRPRRARVQHASQPLLRPGVDWYVYALVHPSRCAPYIGSTNDVARRLRQHNCEIAGGARRTTRIVRGTGAPWTHTLFIRHFLDHRACLSVEKCAQRELRRGAAEARASKRSPEERCARAFALVLQRTAPSSLAVPYASYPRRPEVVTPAVLHAHMETATARPEPVPASNVPMETRAAALPVHPVPMILTAMNTSVSVRFWMRVNQSRLSHPFPSDHFLLHAGTPKHE